MTIQSLSPMWPELIIAGAAMALLMLGVFRPETDNNGEAVGWLAILALIAAGIVVAQQASVCVIRKIRADASGIRVPRQQSACT